MTDDYPLKRHLMNFACRNAQSDTLIERTLLLDYVFLWFIFRLCSDFRWKLLLKELGCFKLDDLKEMFCTMKLLLFYNLFWFVIIMQCACQVHHDMFGFFKLQEHHRSSRISVVRQVCLLLHKRAEAVKQIYCLLRRDVISP